MQYLKKDVVKREKGVTIGARGINCLYTSPTALVGEPGRYHHTSHQNPGAHHLTHQTIRRPRRIPTARRLLTRSLALPPPAGQRQPVLRRENEARLVQGNSSPVTLSCSPRRSSNRMRRISSRLDAHVQLPDAGNDRSLQPRQTAVCRLSTTYFWVPGMYLYSLG